MRSFLKSLVCLFGTLAFAYEEKEPMCLSRFDFDYKVLSKLVALENAIKKVEKTQQVMSEEIIGNKEAVIDLETREDQLETKMVSLKVELKDAISGQSGGPTYVRWGRTSCPGNGTEMIYTGYAAGSHYESTGASVNNLCLPKEPRWGKYDDAAQDGALVYGTEYENDIRKKYFDKNIDDENTPCSVCQTNRLSVTMIPGRNTCFEGWTLEYNGYLFGSRSTHKAASQYVCVDEDLETVGIKFNNNGNILYLAEVRCGSLPCPPYVNGRELACAVCSK